MRLILRLLAALCFVPTILGAQGITPSQMTRTTSTTGLNDSALVVVSDSARRTRAATTAQIRKALAVKAFDSLSVTGLFHFASDSASDFGTSSLRAKRGWFADTLRSGPHIPGVDSAYSIGRPTFRWRRGYFADTVRSGVHVPTKDSAYAAGDSSFRWLGINNAGAYRSRTGKVNLGAGAGSSAAINVDGASYSNTILTAYSGATTLGGINSNGSSAIRLWGNVGVSAILQANALSKWQVNADAAGTATFTSLETTARIIGGSSNGLSIRNSGATRDNLLIADDGTSAKLNDGTNIATVGTGGTSGERTGPAARFSWDASNGWAWLDAQAATSTTGGQGITYSNGTQRYSALEIANYSGALGAGALKFMKSGGQIVFGNSGSAQAGAAITSGLSVTASAAAAYGLYSSNTLVAAANSDVLSSVYLNPSTTPGSFTGLQRFGLNIAAYSVAAFTTPGTAAAVNIGVLTGKAGMSAYGVRIAPPAGGDNNYLIAHTTPSTFSVTAGGTITGAQLVVDPSAGTVKWGSTRSILTAPADGQFNLTNAAVSAGVGFDFATDATLKVRVRAQNADANLSAAKLIASDTIRGPATTSIAYGTTTNPLVLVKAGSDTLRYAAKMRLTGLTTAGATASTVCIDAATFEVYTNAAATCTVSSARFKRDVAPLALSAARSITAAIRPVEYAEIASGRRAIGVIAEQADSIDTRLSARDAKGTITSVNYEQVSVAMLRVVQDLMAKVDSLESRVKQLERRRP